MRMTAPSMIGVPVAEPGDDRIQRIAAMKQRSSAPGTGVCAFGSELASFDVQVDLLVAEPERLALDRRRAAGERLELHAQHFGVEADARGLVGRREYQVVQVVDHRRSPPCSRPARSRPQVNTSNRRRHLNADELQTFIFSARRTLDSDVPAWFPQQAFAISSAQLMTTSTILSIYDRLGVPTVINAHTPATRLSGGIMRAEVADAMREATQWTVDMATLEAPRLQLSPDTPGPKPAMLLRALPLPCCSEPRLV
ncbi:MAG: hypothetical protein IPO58_25280 [Betaproteobacteria bacterium]|nr:hypothetical protein [Betaproteobacteria bacterium]